MDSKFSLGSIFVSEKFIIANGNNRAYIHVNICIHMHILKRLDKEIH